MVIVITYKYTIVMKKLAKTYKLRAECVADVISFLSFTHPDMEFPTGMYFSKFKMSELPIPHGGSPLLHTDVELEFTTHLDLQTIRCIIEELTDVSGAMLDTLNVKKDYTGERWYFDYVREKKAESESLTGL